MNDEQGTSEAVFRTRHKTEWLRRELSAAGIPPETWRLGGKPVAAWSDGTYIFPAVGDPLPFLRDGDGAGARLDASYFGGVASQAECDALVSAMERFAAAAQ